MLEVYTAWAQDLGTNVGPGCNLVVAAHVNVADIEPASQPIKAIIPKPAFERTRFRYIICAIKQQHSDGARVPGHLLHQQAGLQGEAPNHDHDQTATP